MEQPRRDLTFHAFTERKITYGLFHQWFKFKQFIQLFISLFIFIIRDAINCLVEQERICRGDVPRETVALPHYKSHRTQVIRLEFPGSVTEYICIAVRWVQQTGEHLECGCFTSAVGTEKADDLSLCDLKIDLLDGFHIPVLALEETLHCRAESAFALGHFISFAQVFCMNSYWWHI